MATQAPRRTIRQLLRQGWTEIPEILASTGMGLIGVGLAIAGLYNYEKNDGDNRRYKNTYVVMRPDDPRVQYIKRTGDL